MSSVKVFTNTLAQIAGKLSTAIISVFLIKILTNYLDMEGYGTYSKIYNYLSIFSVIADLGLYAMSVREISKFRDNKEEMERIAGIILTLRAAFGVGIIGIALVVALFLPGYNSFANLISITIVGIFTLFGLINSSLLSGLQANFKTEFSFVSTTVGRLASFGLLCILAWWIWPKSTFTQIYFGIEGKDIGMIGVFLTGLIGNIIMTWMLYVYSKKILSMRFRWDWEYAKKLLLQTLPYGLALFLNAVFFKVDVILLSIMQSGVDGIISLSHTLNSFHADQTLNDTIVAVYSLPMKMVEVGMLFGTVFLNSLLPMLTEAKKDPVRLTRVATKSFRVLVYFGTGIACLFALRSSEILSLVANKSYLDPVLGNNSADVLSIVGFVFLFYFVSSLFTYILVATEKQARLLWVNIGIAILNLIANILAIPAYGFMGSAYVTVACQAILVVVMYVVTRDTIQIGKEWKTAAIVMLGAGISVLIHNTVFEMIARTYPYITNESIIAILTRITLSGIIFGSLYLLIGGLLWKQTKKESL